MKTIERLQEDYNESFESLSKKSLFWFVRQRLSLKRNPRVSFSRLKAHQDLGKWTMRPLPGNLYLARYQPLQKNTLPFWDEYPLVLVLKSDNKYVQGVNMHYMHPQARFKYLTEIQKRYKWNEDSLVAIRNLNWNKVSVGRIKWATKASHRRYSREGLVTPWKKIHQKYWPLVCLLPLENISGKEYPESVKKRFLVP